MLREHGEVIGVDSGAPGGAPDGFEAHSETDGVELLDRVRDGGQEPGRANEAPVDRGRARARARR